MYAVEMVCELLEADDLNTSEPSKKKDREDSPKESKYIPIMGNKKGPQQDKEKQQDIFLHDLYLHLDFMSKHTVSSDRWNQSPFPLVPNCPDHR